MNVVLVPAGWGTLNRQDGSIVTREVESTWFDAKSSVFEALQVLRLAVVDGA